MPTVGDIAKFKRSLTPEQLAQMPTPPQSGPAQGPAITEAQRRQLAASGQHLNVAAPASTLASGHTLTESQHRQLAAQRSKLQIAPPAQSRPAQ